MRDDVLVIITARGGSKGIPGKNIKLLGNKPLICWSIDAARKVVPDEHICVTTDSNDIINVVENYGLRVPFKRPDYLATDTCGSNGVLQHALSYYIDNGFTPRVVLLLQPTSPFRTINQLEEAIGLYHEDLDMVVSVKETSANPYYNCYEEDKDGYLLHSKTLPQPIHRRQDAPHAYEFNGSIYVINPHSLLSKGMSNFSKIKKYVMEDIYSIDLDTMFDWYIAETIIEKHLIE